MNLKPTKRHCDVCGVRLPCSGNRNKRVHNLCRKCNMPVVAIMYREKLSYEEAVATRKEILVLRLT